MDSEEYKRFLEGEAFKEFAELQGLDVEDWDHGKHGIEPDIVATIGGRKIGVEITGLTDTDIKRRESQNRKISDAVSAACTALKLPPLRVHMHGLDADNLKPKQRVELPIAIAKFVASLSPINGFITLGNEELPSEVGTFVSILNIIPEVGPTHTSAASQARWMGYLSASDLGQRIAPKQGKRAKYTDTYDEVWLLLTSSNFASWGAMSENVANEGYETDFDRAFVLASVNGARVWELRVVRDS